MKVAFVLGTSTGGTARHVRMLAAGCEARGVPAEVFGPARTNRDFSFSAQASFTPVEIADRPRVRHDLRAIARLRRLTAAWRPGVVHAHGLRAGALTAIALAFVRPDAYHARPALVVTVHNAPAAGGVTGAIYRTLELIVARRADSVLCVSPDLEARMLAAGARRVARALVPAPVPAPARPAPAAPALARPAPAAPALARPALARPAPAAPAPARPAPAAPAGASPAAVASRPACLAAGVSAETPAAPDGRPVVLAVGRLAPQKGFATLLEASASWRDLRPEPLLVIAGEGPLMAGLRSTAARLGVDARFPGHRGDVPALLAAAAVFVVPSVWEGQPLVLQEALRAGVPVVATRVGGIPDLTGEDAALLVPPGDAPRLAGAVRAVLTDPALAARLRKAAVDRGHALPGEDDAVTAALAEYDAVTRTRR